MITKLCACLLLFPLAMAAAADGPRLDHEGPGANEKGVALPKAAKKPGTRFVDLNGDGYDDIVVSNAEGYGVYLYNPEDKPRLQWYLGWTQVLREGKPGDANSLPMIVAENGADNGVTFHDGAMWVRNQDTLLEPGGVKRIPFSELLKVPGPPPLAPAQSLARLHLKPGFTAELVACEPLVQSPVFVDWDARGRMWVVEMGDYPFAPGETTKDGKTGQGKVSPLQTGRIKILEDTNGDGVYDKATTFLDGLTHPTSLAFWKNGVIVASIPDIFYAEDTDGDGHCDKKEVWFTGFTAGNPQHLVNGFEWGLDGWFYGANGESGGDITCIKSGRKVALGANDFRFNPLTQDFEIDAGRSQYGKWRDDWGNLFGNNNSVMGWHYYLPMHNLMRNPGLAVKSVREVINNEKAVFPASPPVRRFNQGDAINTLTSGCSPMPYRSIELGDDGKDVMFICEPANNLVHRELLKYGDITVSSTRHPGDKDSEFIASQDNWFRPTMARTGPDGALYVVDMYRLVLEHPEWIPAQISKGLDLRAGEDKGRIYRIARKDAKKQPWPDFSNPVAALRSPNGWVRDKAMRMIIEKQDKGAIQALIPMACCSFSTLVPQAGDNPSSATQVQALWALTLLGGLEDRVVRDALRGSSFPMLLQDGAESTVLGMAVDDPNPFVQTNALRCAEAAGLVPFGLDKRIADPLGLAPFKGIKLTGDPLRVAFPSPPVRFALALAAGGFPKPERLKVLTALVKSDAGDPRMLTAIRSSMAGIENELPEETRKLIAAKVKQSSQPATHAQALPVIINNNPDRQKVVQQYASVATLKGDAKRGHQFYTVICSVCHKLKGEGNEIGPDLGTIAGKPVDQLIESILDPSKAVEQRYTVQTVTTQDGKDHTGLIIEENGNNITLRSGTATELILVKDIRKRASTNKSLMPDGLENLLKPQDVADVIEWIRVK